MSLLLLFGGGGGGGDIPGAIALTGTGGLVLSGTITAPASEATGSVISAAAFSRDDLVTPLASLDSSFGRKWRDPLNEAGAGSLHLQNTDPDMGALDFGNVVKFSVDDVPRWAMFVRRHDRVSRAPGEERDQITTVSGLGFPSVLDEAVIYPSGVLGSLPFADVRYWNFASLEFDDSSWTAPVEITSEPFSPPPGPGYIRATPSGFPDTTAIGIWSRAVVTNQHPVGTSYFRSEFTVAGTDPLSCSIYVAGDNLFEVWVDGLLVFDYKQLSLDGWFGPAQRVDMVFTPGVHLIACKVTNVPFWDPSIGTGNAYNIGELLMAIYSVDATGQNATLLHNTNLTDWVCLDYPAEPPGFTPGHVMNILLDEAQDRGALLDVSRTWSNTLDSAGVAWPVTADITARVGLPYYSMARQLAETYFDFSFAADALEMSLWIARGADVSGSAQLTGGINLGSLKHTREG